jgi:dTDP-4-amino-4,6-dideoxygalactose transaminase
VNSIIHCGATPVLVDVDPNTMNINAKEIEKAISKRTKAILPVHFGGRLCDMTDISKIAEQYNLDIIEDCAHAVETEKKGQKAGSFGRFAVFSFYATKNLVTGEGGMVLCQNEQDATRIKQLSLHGMSHDAWKRFSGSGYKHYSVVEAGYKYNMTDMQAALGIHQLARINTNYKRRKEIWEFYNREFENLPIITPKQEENDSKHALHLYTILMTKGGPARDNFITQMTEQNIGVGVHYESVAEHPYYQQNYHWKAENWPHAMDIGRRTVSLPISAALSDKDVCDVVGAVKNIVLKRRVVDRHVAV